MFDVVRFQNSDLALGGSHAGIGAALFLWSAAWHQVPAGSLPNNERILARLARCDAREWRKLRDEALHGFVECSDGRLYHLVLCEEATEATKRRQSGRNAARARWAKRPQSEGTARAMRPHSDGNARTGQDRTGQDSEEGTARGREVAFPGLLGIIHQAFITRGKHLILSEHQMGFVRGLTARAEQEADPHDWAHRYLETAWKLRKAGKDVWRGQPWQPSAICGEKMQARVIEAMDSRQQELDPTFAAFVETIGGAK